MMRPVPLGKEQIRTPAAADAWQVARASDVSILARICDPGIGLTVWTRRLRRELGNWLGSLGTDRLPAGRVLAERADIRDAVAAILEVSGTPGDGAAGALISDVAELAERFAVIAESERVDVRLEVLDHDACWKFHQDRIALRMLTTYLGPGTQYVGPHDAARALSEQRAYGGMLHDIPEQAVALFKGSLSDTGPGVVHRSPPIAATNDTRLFLCINPPSPASPDLWSTKRRLDITGAIQPRRRPSAPRSSYRN